MIHIGRAGTNLGSFSEDEVRQGLVTGRFSLTDLGWKEGMANWAPLSQFQEFSAPPAPMPPLPGEAPPEEAAGAANPANAEAVLPGGLPWDERKERGFVTAFAQTVKLILTQPSEAFARMHAEGGLSNPLLFNLIGGWLGMIAAGIYAVLTARMQQPSKDLSQFQALYESPAMAMSALKMFVVIGPVFATMIALVSSVIVHLFLMLAGGANKAFHVTLRVFCFSYGSTQILELLPFCGGLVATVWLLVCCVVGLTIAHRTTTGRCVAAMALFVTAFFVCCMGIFFLAAAASYETLRPALSH